MPERMTTPGAPPEETELRRWLGPGPFGFWERLESHIARHYPSVFSREWLFGGKKHGWSLRYKKSKSFCTLIPERLGFKLLIVFGEKERALVEDGIHSFAAETADLFRGATTYHDGKWLLLSIDDEAAYQDAIRLLALKRKPLVP